MKISTKGRYALRLAIDLAQNEGKGPVALREAAERQSVSPKYLEQLASQLVHAQIIKSMRGAHGGYVLARAAGQITAGDVLRASEGSTVPVACLEDDFGVCPLREQCTTINFWMGLNQAIESYVDSVSLADLAAQPLCDGEVFDVDIEIGDAP